MKPIQLLLPLWLVILFYGTLSFFFGDHGFFVMRELEGEKQRLVQNLDELERINRSLEARMIALKSDSDAIALEARELGLGAAEEFRILLVGRSQKRPALSAGLYLEPAVLRGTDDLSLKKIALSLSLILSMTLWALSLRRKKRDRSMSCARTSAHARACANEVSSSELCRHA